MHLLAGDPPDPKGRKGTPEMLGRKERLARLAQQGRPGWTGPPDPKARLELLEPLELLGQPDPAYLPAERPGRCSPRPALRITTPSGSRRPPAPGGTLTLGATFINPAGLALPVNDVAVVIPVACTITAVTVLLSGTGSCVIDVWRDSYANYPPTVADSICGGNKPTVTSATKYRDTALTGWTTALSAGDILIFKLESVSGSPVSALITLTLEPT